MLKKVVIIDDNQTQLKVLQSHFINNGWEVYVAKNTNEAFEIICAHAPDLIVTDAIMPNTGGFELLKQLRQDDLLSKIPTIVYTILHKNLARLYIKEEMGEYFLTKDEDPKDILALASKAINEHPVEQYDKGLIINRHLKKKALEKNILNDQIKKIIEEKQTKNIEFDFKIEKENIDNLIKNSYTSLMNDERLPSVLFSILYPLLSYDMAVLYFYNFSNSEQGLYFDVKNFIFNPILQNFFTSKYNCNNVKVLRKYIPNSKTITSVKEFSSKLEFDFTYKKQSIAQLIVYSKKTNIWVKENDIKNLKESLSAFFTDRYITKNSQNNIKKTSYSMYVQNKMDNDLKNNFNPSKTKIGIYAGILNISNYKNLEIDLFEEDLDVLNSKISETIINSIGDGEQAEKIKDSEYCILILAQDNIQAKKKFSAILNSVESISIDEMNPIVIVGASSCYINNIFDIEEAKSRAYAAVEAATEENKMVIYAE